ncbi:MAG: helix-turn-helix domain-containing protein [Terracidiphilus sp.]
MPSLEDIAVEGILHALSDPVRTAIYADIVAQECSYNCSMFLTVSDKAIPKSTLSQHFRILREAGLIRGERRGVEMHNTLRCAEIEERFPGLLRATSTRIPSNLTMKHKQRNVLRKDRPGGWSRISKKLQPSAELTTREVD